MDRRLSRLGTRDGNPQPRARNPPVIDSSSGSVHRSRRYNATSRRSLRTSIGGLSSIGSSSNSLITSMEPGSANTTRRSTSPSGISASSCSDSVSVRCVGRTRPTPASNASRLQRRTAPGAQPRLDRRSDRTAPIDVTGSVASTRSITIVRDEQKRLYLSPGHIEHTADSLGGERSSPSGDGNESVSNAVVRFGIGEERWGIGEER